MAGLAKIRQFDYSGGAFRGVARNLIPPNGAYTLQNYLLDEDGAAYKRGGSEYRSTSVFGAGGLRWIWDGLLGGGQRTVFATSAKFGVLDGANAPVDLGGSGTATPVDPAVMGGILFLPGGTMYAGSLKAADYSTGTVAATANSPVLTGTGTSWLANVDAGMLFRSGGRYYVVKSVDSNTQLTLTEAATSTASGLAYTLTRLGTATNHGARVAASYAVAGNRLFTLEGRQIWSSDLGQSYLFPADEFVELPAGAEALGARALDDVLFVFSSAGVFAVTNVFFDLTDEAGNAQRTVEHVNADLVIWGAAGIAGWQNALVCPMIDGVWLVSRAEPPVKVSRSIDGLYRAYVSAGYRPGGATVYRSHYMLPILDSGGSVVDELVCRLDRPTDGYWPWSWLRGHAATTAALTIRVGGASAARQPVLLGAGADGRVLDCSGIYAPAAANASDADATAPEYVIESRDFATGNGNRNTVTGLRIRYELVDAASDDPTLTVFASKGVPVGGLTEWGGFDWGGADWSDPTLAEFFQLPGEAPESDGRDPHPWSFAADTRFLRIRLQSSDPAARMVLRSMELAVRSSGRDR